MVQVVASRVTYGEEQSCTSVNAPGDYRLAREKYVIEFWNGERYYPELYAKAASPTGSRLRILGPQFSELINGTRRANDFDYFLGPEYRRPPYPDRIEFLVVDETGNQLGSESLTIAAVTGGRFRAFY